MLLLCNKQIKQAIQAGFFRPGPSPAQANDKNFGLAWKRSDSSGLILEQNKKSWPGPSPTNSDFGVDRLGFSNFETDQFNYSHITYFFYDGFFWPGTLENLFLFCQPSPVRPGLLEKSTLACWPGPLGKISTHSPALSGPFKKSSLISRPGSMQAFSFQTMQWKETNWKGA